MRCSVFLFVAVLFVSLPAMADSQWLFYYEGGAPTPSGTRLNLRGVDLIEMGASEAASVDHGFAGGPLVAATTGMDQLALQSLFDHYSFQLIIDGTAVAYSYRFAECRAYGEEPAAWSLGYVFEFAAGYFSPGVHVLEGRWTARDVQCIYLTRSPATDCSDETLEPALFFTVGRHAIEDGLLQLELSHISTLMVLP